MGRLDCPGGPAGLLYCLIAGRRLPAWTAQGQCLDKEEGAAPADGTAPDEHLEQLNNNKTIVAAISRIYKRNRQTLIK